MYTFILYNVYFTIFAELNPMDCLYQSLNVNIELMREDEPESQLLLNYIHSSCDTRSNGTMTQIYSQSTL